ncbi:HD domain-containing protein [Tateyamaria sp. SN3-11]|uniref:HD domain-containing protein n=1 Tax=Tateyamaria sp. SN3-11 TaxID=3092147 RepID=UPI0039E82F37
MSTEVFLTKRTRDSIYEYIDLSSIEANVSRHPLFLRLHYIHQNSFTFLTYPTAHMQRHPHSLGVMHVAGMMVVNALRNTSEQEPIEHLALEVREELGSIPYTKEQKELIGSTHPTDGDPSLYDALLAELAPPQLSTLLRRETIYAELPAVLSTDRVYEAAHNELIEVLVFLQGMRLAALLHDVGHPPFSHIVEYGLQASMANTYKDHEKVGEELSEKIFSELLEKPLYATGIRKEYPAFTAACFQICKSILESHSEGTRFYELKKSFLAGDMDADRLDYVRRDIDSTGMTATTYDLGRILDSIMLVCVPGDLNQKAMAVLTTRSLSSLETFFTARFHLYRWAIFHHDVSRRNLCMQRFVYLLLTSKDLSPEINEAADRLRKFASTDDLSTYKYFTDGFFLELLWTVFDRVSDRGTAAGDDERLLALYCDVVLNRNSIALKTLWKRPDEYVDFCKAVFLNDEIVELSKDVISERLMVAIKKQDPTMPTINVKRKALDQYGILSETERANRLLKVLHENYQIKNGVSRSLSKYLFAKEIEEAATEHLNKKGVRIFVQLNSSFKAGPQEDFYLTNGKGNKVSVEEVSPVVAALENAWMASAQLMVFFDGRSTEHSKPVEKKRRRDDCIRAVIESLKSVANNYGRI